MFLLLLLSSCEDKFTQVRTFDFPEHEEQLAVTSIDEEGDIPIVYVSHSKGINDETPYRIIEDATVNFYRDGELRNTFLHFSNGRYVPEINLPQSYEDTIKLGHTYTIEVSAPELETTTASQKLPLPASIENLEYTIDGTTNEYGDEMDLMEIEIDDPGEESNFYIIRLIAEGKDQNGNPSVNEIYFDNLDFLMEYGSRFAYIPDLTFNGNKYIFRLGVWDDWRRYYSTIDHILVQVGSVSKDYYLYDISKYLSEEAEYNPFVEPVLIHSNYSQGYGIFGLMNIKEKRLPW